jgi:hypothetical protein
MRYHNRCHPRLTNGRDKRLEMPIKVGAGINHGQIALAD